MTILLPFNEAGQWLRGSLHCHSTNSDGEVPPEQVAARYKAEGYDFICVTDHFRPERVSDDSLCGTPHHGYFLWKALALDG